MVKTAKPGSVVSIRYKGGAKGEEVLDDHSKGEPLKVMLGDMKLPQGIEEAIFGMKAGESKQVEIPCELGYGSYKDELASWYPRMVLKEGYSLKRGDIMFYTNPDDDSKMPAWVTGETQDTVRLDFNHPYAGKTLEYWIELVDLM